MSTQDAESKFGGTSHPCWPVTPRRWNQATGPMSATICSVVGGVAQAFHDDQVVELRVQFGVEKVDGEGQGGTGGSRKDETSIPPFL